MLSRCLIAFVCAWLAGCAASNRASEEEAARIEALKRDFGPPFCYLVAEQMQLDLRFAAASGAEFNGALPPECDDGTPLNDSAAWSARLSELRNTSADEMARRGSITLPRNVEIIGDDGCGANAPIDGNGEFRQSGHDLKLAAAGAPENTGYAGAIMENHLVILMIGGEHGNDPRFSEPLFGDWTGESVVLASTRPDCTVTIRTRP